MESAIAELVRQGSLRELIVLVEAWNEVGEPTVAARLAEARAFIELCMMDRAWIRLKEVVGRDPENLEAQKLIARMFIERGWPNRARRPLEKVLAHAHDDAEAHALWDHAVEDPVEPDEGLEQSRSPDVLASLARTYLATGALLKGRALLQRIKREHPEVPRVDDLLWVLEGDFRLRGATLTEYTERFAPDLSRLADLADEPEHTESITMEESIPDRDVVDTGAFPSLFRNIEPVTEDAAMSSESTAQMSLAELRAFADTGDAPTETGVEQDTQIRTIIRRDGVATEVRATGELHVATEDVDPDFDLDTFRREMGMRLPSSDLDDAPENEDDDLIVMTRREREQLPPLALDTTGEAPPHPDAARFLAEAERYRAIEEDERRRTGRTGKHSEAPTITPAPRRRRGRGAMVGAAPWWLLALAALLAALAILLFVVVIWQFLGW